MPDQFYAYSTSAAIKVQLLDDDGDPVPALTDLEDKIEIDLVTANNKVKKNKRFFVEVRLPRIDPQNLVPLKKKAKAFRMPVQVLAVDVATLDASTLRYDTRIHYGVPVNAPRRRHRFGKTLPRQTFRFPAVDWTATDSKIVIWVRSIHKYYDDISAGGTTFANRRILSKSFIVPVD